MTANLTTALACAKLGYHVFPCAPDKKPLVKWREASTTDEAIIRSWWMRWPDCIVGIDLAKCNVLVIDCDRHGGPDGVAEWQRLCAAHNFDPAGCFTVQTPSGGQHVYFAQHTTRLGNSTGNLPKGIDVRGHGGYVIAAGSILPDGREYKVNSGSGNSLQPVPQWLSEIIRKRSDAQASSALPVARLRPATERERKYALGALAGETAKVFGAVERTRNKTLNTAAFSLGTMVSAGWLDEGEVVSELTTAATVVGLTEDEAARTIASGLESGRKQPRRPLIDWPAGYEMRSDGLYKVSKDDAKWLCDPFVVLGEARDGTGKGWSLYIEWRDGDGRCHRHALPNANLVSLGTDVLKPLADGGLKVAGDGANDLKRVLAKLKLPQRVTLAPRTGWHNGRVFVLPDETIGQHDDVVIYNGDASAGRFKQKGSLDEWRQSVAMPVAGNPRLIFAIAVAVAGVVADLLGEEAGGFHIVGPSSSGKSTALKIAASVWGDRSFVQNWRATDNGLEAMAREVSGTCLILDELGQLDDRVAGKAAYMLANGRGKARSKVDGSPRERAEWRTSFLSSGETTLADKIRAAGQSAKAGQMLRMINIPTDAGSGQGLFNDTKGLQPAQFAEKLNQVASRAYGTAGRALARILAGNPEKRTRELLKTIERLTGAFLAEAGSAEGQISRIARQFALAAAAGECLNEAVGLPWPIGAMSDAARACFLAHLGQRGGTQPGEYIALIESLRDVTERFGNVRFYKLASTVPTTFSGVDGLASATATLASVVQSQRTAPFQGMLGYRFSHEGEEIWGFTSAGFKEVTREIADPAVAVQILKQNGVLLFSPSDKRGRFAKKIDGRTVMLFAVKGSAFDGE